MEVAIETTLISGLSFSVASKSLAEDRGIGRSIATDLDLGYLDSLVKLKSLNFRRLVVDLKLYKMTRLICF
jgi:hypothetical protein